MCRIANAATMPNSKVRIDQGNALNTRHQATSGMEGYFGTLVR
jgi:hypothetical protein